MNGICARLFPRALTLGTICILGFGFTLANPKLTSVQAAGCGCRGQCRGGCQSDDDKCSYGPGPCVARKTLMQWSYGTSFSGGPDQNEPLVTDRPDFTEASSTVGLGVAQLEIGYTYTYDNDGTDRVITHSYPEPLLRVGILAEWLELRLIWNYVEETTTSGSSSSSILGSEDMGLGLKIGLTPQECLRPEMALIPQMRVPSGPDRLSDGEVLPGLNWIYAWEINDFISTAGSSQFNRALDEVTGEPYLEFAQSWTIAYSLTDTLGAYTEWFALVPDGADTAPTQHFFNGGFTYLFSNDVQFDIRAGLGLNDAAEDYFVGTGLSVRF